MGAVTSRRNHYISAIKEGMTIEAELAAMREAYQALCELTPEARQRSLRWLSGALGLDTGDVLPEKLNCFTRQP